MLLNVCQLFQVEVKERLWVNVLLSCQAKITLFFIVNFFTDFGEVGEKSVATVKLENFCLNREEVVSPQSFKKWYELRTRQEILVRDHSIGILKVKERATRLNKSMMELSNSSDSVDELNFQIVKLLPLSLGCLS